MIIDAHAHAAGEYSSKESILNTIEKYKLEKIILCTSPKNIQDLKRPPNIPVKKSPDGIFRLNKMLRFSYKHFMKENGDGNNYVFELRKKLPEVVLQFLWINPLDKDHMEQLENSICHYQPKGIKLHQAWNPFKIDSVEFNKTADIARAFKLPIFIHLYSKNEAYKLGQFAEKNRDVTFIIAHMLGLDIFRTENKNLKNLYFDTSGSAKVRSEDIQDAISTFGYENVVFGTDTPYAGIEEQVDKIDQLDLSDYMKEHIFSLNIKTILSIK